MIQKPRRRCWTPRREFADRSNRTSNDSASSILRELLCRWIRRPSNNCAISATSNEDWMSKGKAYCPECRAETPVRVQPIFEGFEKVGEKRTCTFCGNAVQDGVKPEAPPTSVSSKTVADLF